MEKLRLRRVSMGLTQGELASQVGTTEGYYRHIEAGRAVPSAETLHGLMRVLQVDAPEAIGFRVDLVETVVIDG